MIFCLQAGAAEEAEVEEVTRPRDSVLVRLVMRRDIREWTCPTVRHRWSHPTRMDHVYLGSCRAPGLLCYAFIQLILT